ncbi:hypothetical protein J3E68DRAFT_432098 [Trichoderma sp. SZMC 28012]
MERTLPLSSAAYHRAAFSSIKHGKLPEVVKKMKADRKGRKETATTDAYKAYMREITTAYREYLEKQTKQLLKQAEEAHGDVHDWARGALYVSDMKTVNGRNDDTSLTTLRTRPTSLRIATERIYINRGIDNQDHEVQDHEVQDHEVQDHEVQDHEVQDHEVQDLEVQNREVGYPLSLPDDDAFLGDDILDLQLSSEMSIGAGLNEIRAFFPSDAPAASEAPAAEVDFDDDEFDDLEWPQPYEFDDEIASQRPRYF